MTPESWISVEDKLPPDDVYYCLVWLKAAKPGYDGYATIATWLNRIGKWFSTYEPEHRITHWQRIVGPHGEKP